MRADVFYKTVTKKSAPKIIEIMVEVDEDATLEEIIAAATEESGIQLAARRDKGPHEVQTDLGIFSRSGKSLVRPDGTAYADVSFKTWEELEAEDAD